MIDFAMLFGLTLGAWALTSVLAWATIYDLRKERDEFKDAAVMYRKRWTDACNESQDNLSRYVQEARKVAEIGRIINGDSEDD